jgi:hypothetical protein
MMAAPTKGMKDASIMTMPQRAGPGIPTIQKAIPPRVPCTAATAKLLRTLAKRTFSVIESRRSR